MTDPLPGLDRRVIEPLASRWRDGGLWDDVRALASRFWATPVADRSLFIDCCHRPQREGFNQLFVEEPQQLRGFPTLVRYVPQPFAIDDAAAAAGTHASPVRHKVKGHARLIGGQPQAKTVAVAPAWADLGPNQTWVKRHQRGRQASRTEVQTYLSRYSALADALGPPPASGRR